MQLALSGSPFQGLFDMTVDSTFAMSWTALRKAWFSAVSKETSRGSRKSRSLSCKFAGS